MNTNVSILFYVKRSKVNASGFCPVYVRVTVNSKRFEFSSNKFAHLDKWSSEAGRIKSTSEEARSINSYLDRIKNKILNAEKTLMKKDIEINSENLRNEIFGISTTRDRMLIPIFEDHNRKVKELVGFEYSPGTLERYETSLKHTQNFMQWNFQDIDLQTELKPFFAKIQQVEELKVTNIQFDFTRVKPKERIVRLNEKGEKIVEEASTGQNTFSIKKDELFVLPANETYGEGLFFQFNNEAIDKWLENNSEQLYNRFSKFLNREVNLKEQGAGLKQKIKNNGIKHFLIHSFAHLMMRELEFSCGYPTASLKERLYISNTPRKVMSGILIYTSEGSEGSMGGLVSQGESEKILEIIKRGLERSINCSSDPLCWESDGQGVFDLNLSACFSCSLVAETACEEMNLGLDRRVLVDEVFGFFKELVKTDF